MGKAIDEASSFHSLGEAIDRASGGRSPGPPPNHDFETIYRQNYAPVWRFLLHLGVRRRDVADVTQNVFLVAYRRLPEFEQRSSLRTWLCGIAWRVARDFMRSAAVRLEVQTPDTFAERPAPDDSSKSLQDRQQLALAMRLLESMPPEQREVFVLHELEQMSGPEIADLMGTPVNTVRSRLKRARDSFQMQLVTLRDKGELDV